MKRILEILALSALALLSAAGAGMCADVNAGRVPFVSQIRFWSAALGDNLQMGLGLAKSDLHYEAGEPIELVVPMRNAGSAPRGCGGSGPYRDYRMTVVDGSGNPAPLTQFGRRWEGGRNSPSSAFGCTLDPGDSWVETLSVSKYYNVSSPGEYIITVTRQGAAWVPDTDGNRQRKDIIHQVGQIAIVVGDLAPESPVALGSSLGPSALPVAWDADKKILTITRSAASAGVQSAGEPTGGARGVGPAPGSSALGIGLSPGTGACVTVMLPDTPAGQRPHLSQRVVNVITTFLDHTGDQVPAK